MPAPVSRPILAIALLAVASLTLMASLARLFGLDHLLIWHDEVFTLVRIFGYSQGEIEGQIFSHRLFDPGYLLTFQAPSPNHGWGDTLASFMEHPEHAPLYYALAKLTALLPLEPVIAARGVAALFGVLVVPGVYWLARELFGRGPIPWVAALLVAISPTHFIYAQEARQYSLWTLTVVLTTAQLLRALRHKGAGDWWLYGLVCTLGLWSHILFALILPLHAAYGLVALRGQPLALPARRFLVATGVAMILFLPWLWVLATKDDQLVHYTKWLAEPIGPLRTLTEWAVHLPRLFLDLDRPGLGWWTLLLIPLLWALARFLRRAPSPQRWLVLGLLAVYSLAMLVPDLLFDGSRSRHVRYALPSMVALQLMVAWVIGDALSAAGRPQRLASGLALAGLAAAGVWSLLAIQGSDTWWSKNYSAENGRVARLINAGDRPLVLASGHGVAIGELISLAHYLDPGVRLWGERWGDPRPPPADQFGDITLFVPSLELIARMEIGHRLVPIEGTWQWLRAEPLEAPATAAGQIAIPPAPVRIETELPQQPVSQAVGVTP